MSQRFQIEDLVVQDHSGVVFRALDTVTGKEVALRRFFPFGGKGGGLNVEEQVAYGLAVKRLAGVNHSALRAVISGGCDAIDGMPFVATEWIEGTRLQVLIDRARFPPDEVIKLMLEVLEVCQLLSQVLKEEAVWVETDLRAIVVGAAGSGREVTFRVDPMRLLGSSDSCGSFNSIITLAEEVMDRSVKMVSGPVGVNLDRWLNWLRGASPTPSLQQAREMLVAYAGAKSPPTPTKHLGHQTARPVGTGKKKKKPSKIGSVAAAFCVLLALGSSGWFLIKKYEVTPAQTEVTPLQVISAIVPQTDVPLAGQPIQNNLELTTASVETVMSKPDGGISPEQAGQRVTELLLAQQNSEREVQARRLEIQKCGGVFDVADRALLLEQKNAQVQLRGQVTSVQFSDKGNGATLYLEFSHADLRNGVRGFVMRKDLSETMTLVALQNLVGKNVQLRGKVSTPTSRNRPEIEITDINAIREVK